MNEETRKLRDSEAVKHSKVCISEYEQEIAFDSFTSGADWGYAQAKREAQGEIEELRDLAAGNMCGYCDHKLNSGYDLQSQLSEERARGEKMREALRNIQSTKKSDLMENPAYWGEMIVGEASEALASYEGGSK